MKKEGKEGRRKTKKEDKGTVKRKKEVKEGEEKRYKEDKGNKEEEEEGI